MSRSHLLTRLVGTVALGAIMVACSEETTSPSAGQRSVAGGPSYSLTSGLLPTGVKVPVGQPLFGSPTPPDRIHGEIIPVHDRRNDKIVVVPGGQRGKVMPGAPTGGDGSEDGLRFLANSPTFPTLYGIEWNAEVQLTRTLPLPVNDSSKSILYAPTVLPPGNSCLESMIWTERLRAEDSTRHYFAYEDWCDTGSDPVIGFPMDLTFQNHYVRTMNGKPVVSEAIETPSTAVSPRCWYLDLYDYSLGGWVQYAQSCGTSDLTTGYGWALWEAYNVMTPGYCPAIVSASAIDIRFLDANYTSSAQPIDASTYSSDVSVGAVQNPPCWSTGDYTFTYPWSSSPTNSWTAATPNS